MADVVHQRQGFRQVGVQPQYPGNGPRDLCDLEGVGQAVAEVVGVAPGEDLGLGLQAAEGTGVDDAVAVALIVVAVGMGGLGVTAARRLLDWHGVGR